MKKYNIYANPQCDYKAVKSGWSWTAFFFTFIWAAVKGMWWISIGIFLVLAMGADVQELEYGFMPLVSIICGIFGNKLIRNNLSSRGYGCKDVVSANNQEGAIALYIKEQKND